jgi:excisionase family DNA binding protein
VTAPPLDAEQAGQLLNVPSSWVLAQARQDRIPHIRLGRYVRFDGAELEDWWHARARGPGRMERRKSGPAPQQRPGP